MINYVWAALIVLSVVYAVAGGNPSVLSESIFSGLEKSCELIITLTGIICFWSGIMKVAEKAKITDAISKILSPITKLLFPRLNKESAAMKAISMNITANMLGLGSAATPLGLKAMKELEYISPLKGTASDEMITFVVINTASVQILPTTIAAMRMKYGAAQPFDILPAIWISSVISVLTGVIIAKVFMKYGR